LTRLEFADLLKEHVSVALKAARVPEPMELEFLVHGGGVTERRLPFDELAEVLFVSEDLFYRVITIGVKSIEGTRCEMFIGISEHPPGPFDETWNQPAGSGPFHVVTPFKSK
jgi:hypothetical protein